MKVRPWLTNSQEGDHLHFVRQRVPPMSWLNSNQHHGNVCGDCRGCEFPLRPIEHAVPSGGLIDWEACHPHTGHDQTIVVRHP